MKRLLKSLPIFGSLLKLAGHWRLNIHLWRVDPARRLEYILRKQRDCFVVQIGSNDGKNNDPIFTVLNRQNSWRALLVEPVPYLFEKLKQNYAENSRVQFANVAIGKESAACPFYYLDESVNLHVPDLPSWFNQLGSFDRNHITKHLGTVVEPFIGTLNIPTVSLSSLLEQYGVSKVDVLHIDTEGYDWTILQQLDLEKFRPKVILFEYKHLQMAERLAALAFLKPFYRIHDLDLSGDYLCEKVE